MTRKTMTREKVNFKEIFDSLPESIVILDKNFYVQDMNDNAESKFRISRKKAQGKPSSVFMPEGVERVARRALEEGRTVFGDAMQPLLRDGNKISIQPVASPLFTKHGRIKGALVEIKDLTASKFLNTKNAQEVSASELGDLVQGLAHELKNPLSGIRGAAQLLVNDAGDKETVKCAEIITKEVDRLRSLLDTLRQLEPFAEGTLEPIDVHEILMEIVYLEQQTASASHVTYKQNYDVTLPPIHGDMNSLKQVFLNLIKNACQSIDGEGMIEISTRWLTEHKLKGQNSLVVEIKDTGRGILDSSLDKIFSPFYTTKKEGSGFGLFLAYQVVAKHRGAILVESEMGKGTTFKVYLPITSTV